VALTNLDETSKGLKTIPPGFTRGLRLPGDPDETEDELLQGLDEDAQKPEEVGATRTLYAPLFINCGRMGMSTLTMQMH
jgi:hypothetical protein